jgi:plastocyanin
VSRYAVLIAMFVHAATSHADPLTGTLSAPLRKKVQLVYVEKADGKFAPPAEAAVVNQKGNKYLPSVLPLLVGSKVSFRSEDSELHNVFARGPKKVLFNQAQLPAQKFEKAFTEVGAVHLTCNIHKEMSAWVVVLQNPYFAQPDPKTGAFAIEGVPPGTYTVRIWGEKLDEEDAARKFVVTVGKDAPPLIVAVQ